MNNNLYDYRRGYENDEDEYNNTGNKNIATTLLGLIEDDVSIHVSSSENSLLEISNTSMNSDIDEPLAHTIHG